MASEKKKLEKIGLVYCELDDILFPVEKVMIDEFECNSDYAYDIFAYPDGRKLRVNSCSEKYALVPNNEIFPPIEKLLEDNGIKFNAKYMHMNHARFYAEIIIDSYVYNVGGNSHDKVKPMLKVQHSYNGLCDYKITFGYFRLVCTNGLIIPVAEKSEYNIQIEGKHTVSIHESLKKLDEAIKFFLSQGEKPMFNYNLLYDHWVENWKDRVVEVLNVSKIANISNKKFSTVEYISDVVNKESKNLTNGKVNDWLIYNAVNRYVNDNKLNIASPQQRYDKERRVMNFLLKDIGVGA